MCRWNAAKLIHEFMLEFIVAVLSFFFVTVDKLGTLFNM